MISPPARARFETGSLLQALLSLFGLGTSLLSAAALLVLALVTASSPASENQRNLQQFITLAWIALFLGLLCLPSLWFSALRLFGKTVSLPMPAGFPTASGFLLIWPLLLLAGSLVSNNVRISAYLLPPLTILVTAIPIWWLVELARRGLAGGPQRSWGTLIFALFFTNPLTMILEISGLLALAVIVGLILGSGVLGGYVLARLQYLYQEILQANGDSTRIQQLILPLLSNPWIVLGGISIISGLVPLLEELCKSLAVWVLLGRKLSPSEGFVIGAIAGAGFALTESLFGLSNSSLQSEWLTLVIGRTGTGILHITTAALVGMGLASAWRTHKFQHFGLAYLSAVLLHGLWNLLSITSGLASYLLQSPSAARTLSYASLGGMILLSLLLLFILLTANRRLRTAFPLAPAVSAVNTLSS